MYPKQKKDVLKYGITDFEEPEVYTYSLESTIAEKFDSILKRMEATSRMKDFFDIYYLSSMFDFDGRKLQEAVWQTVQYRGTVYEAKSFDRIYAFNDNVFLSSQWTRFQPSVQVKLPEFASILNCLKEFLQPVFEASIKEREFFMDGSAEQKKWQDQSGKGNDY